MLKTSNFTVSHNVFYLICILKSFNSCNISVVVCSFFELRTVSKWCRREWVNPFPNKPWFLRVYSTSLLKTLWEKEKLLIRSVFYPFEELSVIFIKFEICRLQALSVSKSVKFVLWERVNTLPM